MTDIRTELEAFMRGYVRARTTERFGKASPSWQALMALRDRFAALEAVRALPRIQVRASAGQGSWARIPWIAFLHQNETDSTRRGVYVIYLFRADMSGVYLTLNQGVTQPLKERGTFGGIDWLRQHARDLRPRVADLARRAFSLDSEIDLGKSLAIARHYNASTVAYKLYRTDELPSDEGLTADLAAAIQCYEALIRGA